MSFAIETQGLRYRPGGAFAIDDVDMHVPTGAVYGFLGPNGAGKTTTIRLVLGLLRPQGGRITVLGSRMPDEYIAVLARTGYVPERPHLYPGLTVEEVMRLHASFHRQWDGTWADELLGTFALPRERRVAALSKGETGKLMMLLALAQCPDLLVLDEPTDGLDPVVRREVLEALLAYVSARRATVLISSHLVHELERICDWTAIMDHGRLIAELPMQELKQGIKRLWVAEAPSTLVEPPFSLLGRQSGNGRGEQWLVRGWQPGMQAYFDAAGIALREVIDLDLEEGFVEMLRSFRNAGQ